VLDNVISLSQNNTFQYAYSVQFLGNRQIRKVTKTKGVVTSDMALLKLMYLATCNERNGPCLCKTGALPSASLVLLLETAD
jgi:hypothetical protein